MKSKKNNLPEFSIWIPECKNIQEGSISFDIMIFFIKSLTEFSDLTIDGVNRANKMWDEFVEALIGKYDPDHSCGNEDSFHTKIGVK